MIQDIMETIVCTCEGKVAKIEYSIDFSNYYLDLNLSLN